MSETNETNAPETATSQSYAQQEVRIDSSSRTQWDGKVGRAVKFDRRDGMPYIGVQFPEVGHIVWFFESEFSTALRTGQP